MIPRYNTKKITVYLMTILYILSAAFAQTVWIDVYQGEPVRYQDMISDLNSADVVYIGERHTIPRHHNIQLEIIKSLSQAGKKILLGLEQLGSHNQQVLDKYNDGKITLDQMIEQTDWKRQWSNYQDYIPIVSYVQQSGGKIVGLNARPQIIRSISREGLDSLDPKEREQLPKNMNFEKPGYRRYLSKAMMVMSHLPNDADFLERIIIAQMSRDEVMAESLHNALNKVDQDWIAVVVCGSGHVRNGAGLPDSLRERRENINDRIIVLSASGELELSARERSMAREINFQHTDFELFSSPISHYLCIVPLE